jgi:hypothetical protein
MVFWQLTIDAKTGRDNTLPLEQRIELVEAKVAELVGFGARIERRTREEATPATRSIASSCTTRRATNSA